MSVKSFVQCAAVINVRLETARMANGRGGNGIAGLEVLAYGTGIKLRHGLP